MRSLLTFFLCTFMLILCTSCFPMQQNNEDGLINVTKVVDGDTIKVMLNGEEETIRFLLVDTPETVHPTKEIQPFGSEASNFTKDHLEGEMVKLELDVSERDKYGRILAYVYKENGEMINELLLKEGLARVAYVFPPNVKYVDQFQLLQREAQKKGLGIWSIENYVSEEGFKDELDDKNHVDQVPENNKNCVIKGNINSKGDKIYHMLGFPNYKQTVPEVMFCSEKEAQEAGFRKPLNVK
jgi:micrococcal nuclease